MKKLLLLSITILLFSCKTQHSVSNESNQTKKTTTFDWKGANLYFLMTDRFKNGNPNNDVNFGRTQKTGVLRGFDGGDLRGIIQKIDDNYFTNLGINAIWFTPIVEQIHGLVDEGTGKTYAFHGYWTKDWSAIDPNFGTKADLKELVEKAHKKGIRVVMDIVINHTGPITSSDEVYPNNWVRTSPKCTYQNYITTTACTLVENLPDILTEDNHSVELPKMLADKWKSENRYEKEISKLNVFFAKTGLPKAPKYYIMSWLADYITDYGIDGFRIDTTKHVNEDTWKDFYKVCQDAFNEYKKNNPTKVLDNSPFFNVGEVSGYDISQKTMYNFSDKKMDYYKNGLFSLLNFGFRGDAKKSYEELFNSYDAILHNDLKDNTVMNFMSSHDESYPFDKERTKTFEAGTKLLLAPGISQIYYGDETARPLIIEGTVGDATLRSDMNWDDINTNSATKKLLIHYQKLGKFRSNHSAIGAGNHHMISNSPYWFSRIYKDDKVVVGLDLAMGKKTVDVSGIFDNGTKLRDAYSGLTTKVINGKATIDTEFGIVLFEKN